MSIKILVADDSPTIQKVIQITLASSNYELTPCLSFESLNQEIKSNEYQLVLLDFSLDMDLNGYQISQEIKKNHPLTKILVMFGTFDEFDSENLSSYGIEGAVVKPFESRIFIELCEEIINNDEINLANTLINNDLSDWKIDDSEYVNIPSELDLELPIIDNSFPEENSTEIKVAIEEKTQNITFSGTVPSKIQTMEDQNESDAFELPPVIINSALDRTIDMTFNDEQDDEEFDSSSRSEEIHLPVADDLAYPSNNYLDQTKVIADALEVTAEEFWSIDDSVNSISVDEDVDNVEDDNDFNFEKIKVNKEEVQTEFSDIEITAKVFEKVQPLLDQKIQTYCEQQIASFIKESLPALANMAIEKEIKRLTDMVE